MDRFVLFFVLLTLSPGRGQVFNFFKKLYLFVFGAADSQQKVKIVICDCKILTFVPGGLWAPEEHWRSDLSVFLEKHGGYPGRERCSQISKQMADRCYHKELNRAFRPHSKEHRGSLFSQVGRLFIQRNVILYQNRLWQCYIRADHVHPWQHPVHPRQLGQHWFRVS